MASRSQNLRFPRQHAAAVRVVHGDGCAGLLADAGHGQPVRRNRSRHRDQSRHRHRAEEQPGRCPACRSSSGSSACWRFIRNRRPKSARPAQAILDALGLKEDDRTKPTIVSSQVIRRVDDHQTQLINRMRHGNMILAGQTLYIMECEPAGYAALAANEAEKAAEHQHVGSPHVRQLRPPVPGRRRARHRRRLPSRRGRNRRRDGQGSETTITTTIRLLRSCR